MERVYCVIKRVLACLIFCICLIAGRGGMTAWANSYELYAFFNYSTNQPLTQDFLNQHSLTISLSCNGKRSTIDKNSIKFGSRDKYPLSTVARYSHAWDDIIPNGKTVAYHQVASYSASSYSLEEVMAEQYYLEGYTLDGVWTSLHKRLSLTHQTGNIGGRKNKDNYMVLDAGNGGITLNPHTHSYTKKYRIERLPVQQQEVVTTNALPMVQEMVIHIQFQH